MKRLALFLYLIIPCAQAQTDTFWLKEATIKASRFHPEIKFHRADTILSGLLADQSAANIFQRENYLYNRQYGISGIQTPGFRGLSAQQTNVLWNGVPIGNPMLGLSDLSIMPVFFTDDISIEPGPSSSVNGNGAMGGTLHLHNSPVQRNSIIAGLAYNSLNNRFATMKITREHRGFYSSLRALYRNEENRFNYKNTFLPGNPSDVSKSIYYHSALMHEFGHSWKNGSKINLRSWWNLSERSLPPSMIEGYSRAVLTDNFARIMADYLYAGKKYKQTLRAAYADEMNIYNGKQSSIREQNHFQSYYVSSETETTNRFGRWAGHVGMFFSQGQSSHYVRAANQSYGQLGLSHARQWKTWHQVSSFKWMFVNSGLSPFALSSFTTWTPAKGKSYFLNLSNGFRIPTLNEMYWVPGGNRDLMAEKSLHAETGMQLQTGDILFKQQLYYTPTRNLVRWFPSAFGAVTPQNIAGTVQLFGMESQFMYHLVRGKHTFRFKSNWHINYALTGETRPYAQLDYVPVHSGYAELLWKYSGFIFMISNQYTSKRRVQGDELAGFFLTFMNLSYTYKKQRVFIDLNNLFNASYQMIAWYPMPGFNAQLRFQITLYDQKFK